MRLQVKKIPRTCRGITQIFLSGLTIQFLSAKEALSLQKFSIQDSAKCCTALSIVAERYKLYVEYVTWAEASDYTGHSLFCFAVTAWLWAVFLVANNDWMFWSARKIQFLWK